MNRKKLTSKKWLISILTAFLFLHLHRICGSEAAAREVLLAVPSVCGTLRTEGTKLVDSRGNAVQLKGISTHGIAWYPDYINRECFEELRKNWDVNVIRLTMYTAESGGYCTDGDKKKLKKLIRKGVSCATDNDMYVIIDWHILSDNNPNMYVAESMAFFDEISVEYADHNNVLYEICNEPNGGTSWADIKSYAEEIIPVIRQNDPDAVILVGTPNWSQYVDQAASDPITGYDNIMYTLHFYAATHKDDLRSILTGAVEQGLPVFVSEYGICDASGSGAIDEAEANRWMEVLDEYQISCVAWNLSNKEESSAILKSTCVKTSGFAEDDLSASGRWLYCMLTGKPAQNPDKPENTANGSAQYEGHTVSDDDMEYTATIRNFWETGGQTFYQYDLTLKNTSESACSSWSVNIKFNETFTLSDGWNGSYTAEKTNLHISSMDYNGHVEPGASVSDIGFIISGSKNLTVR